MNGNSSKIKCYNCKKEIVTLHSFYNEMCQECGEFNFSKRNQQADLNDYTALVTGGRIKIGYETALKLLRCGAKVIVTSRFPHDCGIRFSQEKDFENWKNKLFVYGLDLRHILSVYSFIDLIKTKFSSLDIIINNAAQTVRRPSIFYRHLLGNENNSDSVRDIKELFLSNKELISDNTYSSSGTLDHIDNFSLRSFNSALNSAELSQIPIIAEDELELSEYFPVNKFDKDGQQEDRRSINSWMQELDEVDPVEFMEVLYINLFGPFLFNTQFKSLIISNNKPSFIINVSAMEGNFYDLEKNSRHPHTNMAKAALNMMTRTSSKSYADLGIYMNSVDVGYITNEKPYPLDMHSEDRKDKMAIDEKDGAARILDPIFVALNTNQFEFGKLYKNYRVYPW